MSNEDDNKYFRNPQKSSTDIASGVGGAIIGNTVGGLPGAIIGAAIGLIIAYSKVLSEKSNELSAKNEITKWQAFFYDLPANDLIEIKLAFAESLKSSSSYTEAFSNWTSVLDGLSLENRKMLKKKKKIYEVEKELQDNKDVLDKLHSQTEKEKIETDLDKITKSIQNLSPSEREEIIKKLQPSKDGEKK